MNTSCTVLARSSSYWISVRTPAYAGPSGGWASSPTTALIWACRSAARSPVSGNGLDPMTAASIASSTSAPFDGHQR